MTLTMAKPKADEDRTALTPASPRRLTTIG